MHGGGLRTDRRDDRRSGDRRRFLLMGAGAVAATAVVAAGVGLMTHKTVYATKRGEVRLVPLADGSSVTLNTDSRISVAFSAGQRIIDLLQGEALFEVIKDPARPFVVMVADTQIVAPAASFVVRRLVNRSVKVMVRDGQVVLRRGQAAASQHVDLTANTAAIAASNASIEKVSLPPSQVERGLAWREGMLSFEDERLDQAVAEFVRYSDTEIVIDDPSIGAETVTGLFSANDPEGFARAVASTMKLRSWKDGQRLHLSHPL